MSTRWMNSWEIINRTLLSIFAQSWFEGRPDHEESSIGELDGLSSSSFFVQIHLT